MAKKSIVFDPETLLRNNGFKVTPLRTLLLETLFASPHPVTAKILLRKTKKLQADSASIYRALSAFTEKGIVQNSALEKNKASYEIIFGKEHTHHIKCVDCGSVETIVFCIRGLHISAAKKSRRFKSIIDHKLSFSGTCRKCLRTVR